MLTLFFAFGFAFEIPVATLLLVWSGISTAASIAHKRPYVIVGCFIAGMFLTPPDVISQLLLALPTWVLFEVGVLFARIAERNAVTGTSAPRSRKARGLRRPVSQGVSSLQQKGHRAVVD